MKKMFRKSCISLCMLCLMLFCTRNVYAAKTDSLTVGGYAGEVNDSEKNGANSSLLRSSVKLDNTKLVMYPTQTKKLIPYSAGNKVSGKWKSSNKSVVSVSSKGKLTAKKAGTATITVTVEGTSATCKVTVKNPSLKLGSSSLALDVGKSKTIKAAATGISNKITWSSSNKSVATVNSSGKVTAKKAGSCTITAKANGITAKCRVSVTDSTKDTVKFITSKAWDIYEDYKGDHLVTSYAFLPNGNYYCMLGYVNSEYVYGVHGTYKVNKDSIKLSFRKNGKTKSYSYKVNAKTRTFTQTSDIGFFNTHKKGQVLRLEKNPYRTRDEIKKMEEMYF